MAQEEDPEKLKKWEEEQSIWLEMVASEEAEKRAASSSKPVDGPKHEQGSTNMPDAGNDDKAPPEMENRPRSRSLSSEARKSPRRFYTSRAMPEVGRLVSLPIPEVEEEEDENKPEEGSKKQKRRSRSKKPEMAPPDTVKEEKVPDVPPGPDGGAGAAAAAVA